MLLLNLHPREQQQWRISMRISLNWILPVALLCLSGLSWADAASQTDWQGGPGVPGPVTNWGDRFDIGLDLDWDTTPGQLKLIIKEGEFPVGTLATAVNCEASDFDYDGDMDIVACNQYGNSIVWFENLDSGDSWETHSIATCSAPMFVQVADLEGDGDRDVIASLVGSHEIVWWENRNGGTTWLTHVLEGDFDARQLRTQDFDGDGDFDIVGVSSASGDVVWWKNRLAQGLPWQKNYIDGSLLGAWTCAAGDFDGDGDFDVAAGTNSTDDIVIYLNDLQFTGSWIKQTVDDSATDPYWLIFENLDSDSRLELVAALASRVSIYDYSDTLPGWIETVVDNQVAGAWSVASADLDSDGDKDLAAMAWYSADLIMYEHEGSSWIRTMIDDNAGGGSSVVVADIDGDLVPDLAGTLYNENKVSWWRIGGFATPGVLQSSIFDTGIETAIWQYIFYSYELPQNTYVNFNVRSSDDPDNMGPWSPTIYEPGSLVGYLENGDRYMQYQVTLATANPYLTPSLKDVTILWTPTGIEGGGESPVLSLLTPNPARGSFTLSWSLEQPGAASLVVFDASGRIVRSLAEGWQEAGTHQTVVDGLPAGIYAACLQGEGFTALRRVVVLP